MLTEACAIRLFNKCSILIHTALKLIDLELFATIIWTRRYNLQEQWTQKSASRMKTVNQNAVESLTNLSYTIYRAILMHIKLENTV